MLQNYNSRVQPICIDVYIIWENSKKQNSQPLGAKIQKNERKIGQFIYFFIK